MIEPATVDEVAAILVRASANGERVRVRGSGTKLDWGEPQAADVDVAMTRLNAVVAHRHGDLTATIQAGARLGEVNRTLAAHGQWLPLDPPFADRATVGGIIATNDSGPRRHRYGAPRDLIIGVDFVRADGVRAKAGGIVVKNVAGYDLARLMTGSFGTLAVVTSATFKLFPIPAASQTVVFDGSIAELGAIASTIASGHLTPTAIDIHAASREGSRLLVRFESTETAAAEQAGRVATLAPSPTIAAGQRETELWQLHDAHIWNASGIVVKATMLPADVTPTIAWIADVLSDADWTATGRAALGVLLVRVDAARARQAAFVRDLRARFAPGRGNAAMLRASDDLKREVGVWGAIGNSRAVMTAIKKQFDPAGILPSHF
ncbi:MAG TPA: FAD-binding oxidoreductase [Vicinamibacterales bacterium]